MLPRPPKRGRAAREPQSRAGYEVASVVYSPQLLANVMTCHLYQDSEVHNAVDDVARGE
jgi:hypothetical protein